MSAMPPRPPQNDTVLTFVLLVGVVIGGIWFLWFRYHPEIASAVVALQSWEMRQFSRVTDNYRDLAIQVAGMDTSTMTARQLYQLCHFVGLFLRWPATFLVGALACVCVTRSAAARFTASLDVDRLIQIQARVFRPLAVMERRRLKPVPLGDGAPRPLDPALHLGEWIRIHATDKHGGFDEGGTRGELAAQLCGVWVSPEAASPIARCLFAVFALHMDRQRERARALLGEIAESLAKVGREGPEGPIAPIALSSAVVSFADAVILERELVAPCRRLAERHAFTAPALMTLLWEARRKAGVLAPAEFLFTKLVDRRLWFALHGLGFPAERVELDVPPPNPRIEALGSQAHWLAERRAGRPLRVPQIEQALVSIRVRHAEAEEIQSRKKAAVP